MATRNSAVRLIRSETLADVAEYAYAATTVGTTRPIYLAGACPLDAEGRTVAAGDVAGQARQCVDNLVTALGDAQANLEDVIYTRVLVATTRQDDLVEARTVVRAAFGSHDVPSTLRGVTVLGYRDQLVEVEAVAAVSVTEVRAHLGDRRAHDAEGSTRMSTTPSRVPSASEGRWIGAALRDFPWVHLTLGLVGNTLFVVGSVLFFWASSETLAIWFFVVGSTGMLLGSVGELLVRIEKRRHGAD